MKTGKFKLLLAEDDQDDIELFQEIVSGLNSNISVSVAVDGYACIELATNNQAHFDLVFLDINMPRQDGFWCLQKIRQITSYSTIPIIILSTADDYETIQKANKLGANAYISKTWRYSRLRDAIEKTIKNHMKEV
jgi:PleD family two-component response regulator